MRFLLLFICVLINLTLGHPPLQSSYENKGSIHSRSRLIQDQNQNGGNLKKIPAPKYKLNDTLIPSAYDLELIVILDEDPEIGEQYTAPGKIRITAKPTKPTSILTLHSNMLRIDEDSIKVVKASDPSPGLIKVLGIQNDTEKHFLIINIDQELEVGLDYYIAIDFIAPISRDRINGLYLSTYIDPISGEERRQAVTQMEPISTRQLFPCLDEPGLKARFNLSLIHKSNYSATLANFDLLSSFPDPTRPGWTIDTFDQTPEMSTYLFAIVVSDFGYVETLSESLFQGREKIRVRIYGRKDLIQKGAGDYSLNVTEKLFTGFNNYFESSFPFPKLDSVAVPNKGMAMENYALILYRQDLLIFFEEETTEQKRYDITDVIAHEVAHQNFGNLVTCKWWSVIWLNEGFASYLSKLGVEMINPEFRPKEKMLNDYFQYSMILDGSEASHPLSNHVSSPAEISGIFSSISYEKGGSIIRMIESFLTEQTLQKGLRYYLKEMELQSAEQDDLFRNLQKAAEEDARLPQSLNVKEILDTWTLQRGFPLIKVSVASPGSLRISQEPFINYTNQEDPLWHVPITIVSQDKPTLVNKIPEFWLPKNESSKIIPCDCDTDKWVMINQDATGYYRTLYDQQLTNLIQTQLQSNLSLISPLSRSQLLDDYFTLAFQNRLEISVALNLTKSLNNEDHFTVWKTLFSHLQKTYNLFSGTEEQYLSFKSYFLPRITSALLKVGLPQNPEHKGIIAIYRSQLFDWFCSLEHPLCYDTAKSYLSQWMDKPQINPIPLEIRGILECAIISSGGLSEFYFIFEKYANEPVGTLDKFLHLNALGCTKNIEIIIPFLLEEILNPNSVLEKLGKVWLIQRISMSSEGRVLVLQFLRERIKEIIDGIGDGNAEPIGNIITSLCQYYKTHEELYMLEAFITTNWEILSPIWPTYLSQALQTLRGNIDWMDRFGLNILTWLNLNSN